MMYQGSEAVRLDYLGEATPRREQRTSFEVVEGAGLDHLERRGVSPQFIANLKLAAAVCVALVVLCVARIGVYSMAVGTLASNESMRSELKQTVALEDDLRIQRSVLSSTQRIDRIATQSYGMVAANGAEKLSVSDSADSASEGTADEATDAQAADAAPDATQAQKSSDEVASEVGQATQTQGDGSTAGANAADVDSLS
ncbi:hypothetical protein [Parolsenella catena]|uniref:hypothetical protein n=1 Tax=Parolsenella catena TaxID=2003188 RepID=UPI002FDCD7C2